MSMLSDIKTLLTSIDTTNCYLGDIPDSPDNITALFNTGGYAPELTLDGHIYQKPTFQVRVRDASYSAGIIKCEAIKLLLCKVSNVTINGTFYQSIRQLTDILSLGKDSGNRSEFSINFTCVINK